jgi:hypothetical protein
MTLARGVLRLVRLDAWGGRAERLPQLQEPPPPVPAVEVPALDLDSLLAARAPGTIVFRGTEPGFADLEAAVALVESGLARRVVLHGFESWPGLLWQAYHLAEDADVLILPTAVHPGGRVDIAVTGNRPLDG